MTTNNEHAAILLSIGMGFKDLTLPVAFAVCVDIGQHKSGTVSGAMNMFGQLGAVFLGVVFGYIVKMNGGDFNAPLYLISGLLFLGSLLWLVIDPTEKVG
jgi:nitrate/nitrite transporter NarK